MPERALSSKRACRFEVRYAFQPYKSKPVAYLFCPDCGRSLGDAENRIPEPNRA